MREFNEEQSWRARGEWAIRAEMERRLRIRKQPTVEAPQS